MGKYHHVYMVLQDKEGSRWEAHKTQILPVCPCKYSERAAELLGYLLPSGQLDFFQIHDYPKCFMKGSHQVSIFFLSYTQDDLKTDIFMDIPIGFGV